MPRSLVWLKNPAPASLALHVGNRVSLHADGAYRYLINALVTAVNPISFTAKVVAVFDRDLNTQVLGGDILAIVGTEVALSTQHVFAVI